MSCSKFLQEVAENISKEEMAAAEDSITTYLYNMAKEENVQELNESMQSSSSVTFLSETITIQEGETEEDKEALKQATRSSILAKKKALWRGATAKTLLPLPPQEPPPSMSLGPPPPLPQPQQQQESEEKKEEKENKKKEEEEDEEQQQQQQQQHMQQPFFEVQTLPPSPLVHPSTHLGKRQDTGYIHAHSHISWEEIPPPPLLQKLQPGPPTFAQRSMRDAPPQTTKEQEKVSPSSSQRPRYEDISPTASPAPSSQPTATATASPAPSGEHSPRFYLPQRGRGKTAETLKRIMQQQGIQSRSRSTSSHRRRSPSPGIRQKQRPTSLTKSGRPKEELLHQGGLCRKAALTALQKIKKTREKEETGKERLMVKDIRIVLEKLNIDE